MDMGDELHPECASRLWALEYNRFAVKTENAPQQVWAIRISHLFRISRFEFRIFPLLFFPRSQAPAWERTGRQALPGNVLNVG